MPDTVNGVKERVESKDAAAAEQKGLVCRHCGCRHFRVIYTLPALPRHLHPPRVGRADHAAAGVSALWEANDDVGTGRRVNEGCACRFGRQAV